MLDTGNACLSYSISAPSPLSCGSGLPFAMARYSTRETYESCEPRRGKRLVNCFQGSPGVFNSKVLMTLQEINFWDWHCNDIAKYSRNFWEMFDLSLVGALDGFKHTTSLQSCFWVIVWLKFVAFRFVPKTSSRACSCGCRILPSSATCRGWCRSLQHKWSWCAIPGAVGHWAWLPAWCFWVLSVNLVNGCRCIRQRIWKSKAQSNQRQKALQTWWRAYLDQPVVFGNAWPFQSYLSCCSYEQLVLFGFQSIGGVLSTRWCLKTSSDLLSWSLSLLVLLYSFPFWMPSWSSTLVLFVYKFERRSPCGAMKSICVPRIWSSTRPIKWARRLRIAITR